MATDQVVVLDFWASPFAMRVKIALAEKGVEFETKHEDDLLGNKSELLLKYNPLYKKVPVLLHNGKPICESLVILSYIDEAWPAKPLLPACPYERYSARFWADFVDKKLFDAGNKLWKTKGDAQRAAKVEFIDTVKLLEGALGEKKYFGGESFGFLDIAIVPITSWFSAYEKFGSFRVEDECPKFSAWMKRCADLDTVSKVLPDPAGVYDLVLMLQKMFGAA